MRMFVAVLVLLLFASVAAAQGAFPAFSEPPAGIADFVPDIVNPSEKSQAVVNLWDVPGPIADEAVRTGLCDKAEPVCSVVVSIEVMQHHRCIAQNDAEYSCNLRMNWKRRELVRIAMRYLLSRGESRAEGLAVEDLISGIRFFSRSDGPNPVWEELPSDAQAEGNRRTLLVKALLTRL